MGNGQSAASRPVHSRPMQDFSVALPAEVIAHIVAAISETVDASEPGYKRDLASCALTCRSWSKYLRPHLFAFLTLRSYAEFEDLLRFIDHGETIRPKVARLDLQEGDARWIHRVLRALPSQLPAVTDLRLSSNAPSDASDAGRDGLPELCAALPQVHHLELAGSAFDELPTVSACVSAFPALTSVRVRGITWTRSHTSESHEPLIVADTAAGDIPWLWTLADPFGAEQRPVLADADAAVFVRLAEAAAYNSRRATVSFASAANSDDSEWSVAVHYTSGNRVSVTMAPTSASEASSVTKDASVIRSASLHLTPAGSTVNADAARQWQMRIIQLDRSYHALLHTMPLTLHWEYVGTIEWYVTQSLKNTLFRRLWETKRLVYHLSKGVEPPRARYLPMAMRHH